MCVCVCGQHKLAVGKGVMAKMQVNLSPRLNFVANMQPV